MDREQADSSEGGAGWRDRAKRKEAEKELMDRTAESDEGKAEGGDRVPGDKWRWEKENKLERKVKLERGGRIKERLKMSPLLKRGPCLCRWSSQTTCDHISQLNSCGAHGKFSA